MWNDFPLAAVKPVANGVKGVLTSVECPKPMPKLVAAKPVTSLSRPLDEHEIYRNV